MNSGKEKELIYKIVGLWKSKGPGTCIYMNDSVPNLITNWIECNLGCVAESKELQFTGVSMA